MPAWLGLCTFPARHLFDLVASSAAGARIAGVGLPAFVVGDGMFEVRFMSWSRAWREGALVIAYLDEAAEFVGWLVGVDLVPVVTRVGGHDVEPQGQFAAAGQGECPGS